KEKIQASLIHLEKEKFPCSDETGDAGRHDPRQRPDRMPEMGSPRLVPSPSSLLGSSALSPVSIRARAPHRQAQRRLPGQRHRGWREGGAAGMGCPMEMGFGEASERETRLLRLTPDLPAPCADSSLLSGAPRLPVAAGGETPAPRQGPGHRAPAQPTAREAAAGAYGAEWRGGASRGAGSPWTSASAGAPVGPAGCGGHISPRKDATAATVVPFQRMLSPRWWPEVFYSLSDRGAHRGYPILTPRVCVWLFGTL
ncbi:hypothetical protein EI555_015539, partial [Monodon monoceros]